MKRVLLVLAILAIAATPASAQEPKVRASLDLKGDCWVGQRATLVVELLAPGLFAGSPGFDLPDPPGVLLVPPRGSPTLGTEDIDGVSYTVQRHELSVIARRAGEQKIPPITVRFHFKRNALDKAAVPASVTTAPLTFTAKAPPGAEALGGVISARGLTAVESWKPAPGKAKAGDAFTRTITFAADDVPGMAFPVFPAAKVDGLGVYSKPPDVIDHDERGQLHGERHDAVTYVCQRPGTFVLPAVRLTWFDLDAKKLQTIDFPERTLDVAPNPAMATAAAAATTVPSAGSSESHVWRAIGWFFGVAAVAVVAVLVWRRYGERILTPFRPVHLVPLNPSPREADR